MKRPRYWLRNLFVIGLFLVIGEYIVLTYVAPHHLIRAARSVLGADLIVDEAHLSPLLTTTLTGLASRTNTPAAAVSVQQVILRPRGVSTSLKTVRVHTLEFEQPVLRFTWTREGTVEWPSLLQQMMRSPLASQDASSAVSAAASPWQVRIDSIKVVDGIVEFIDEKPWKAFHGAFDHISFILGPVRFPSGESHVSFAVRGRAVGFGGHSAPLYCSGWLDMTEKALEASCQLEPLALAAFQPYYQGPPEIRVYGTTLKSTSQWIARANTLNARLQLELGNLQEGDISVRGRAILDVKQLTRGQEPRLRGEVTLTGPLDDSSQWRAEFIAGDEGIQQVVGRLLERGIQIVNIPFLGRKLGVSIGTTDADLMRRFDEVGKEISEALEILVMPSPEEVLAPSLIIPPTTPIEATTPPVEVPAAEEQAIPLETLPPATPAPALPQPVSPPQPISPPESTDQPADSTTPITVPAPVR